MEYFDEDIQLMLRFQKGEESCFEQLVERHKNRVFNVAYRFVGNYADTQDIAQQTFTNVYRAKRSYAPKAKFTTWLYTICKNACLKQLKRKKLCKISLDEHIKLQNGSSVTRQIADKQTQPQIEEVLDKERVLIVKAAIDSLPANQKTAVILYRYEQIPYDEIAKVMGLSVKAVKSLLHRAKINLRDNLAPYIGK